MEKFTANYCNSNSNFIIKNLPQSYKEPSYMDMLFVIQNIIMRGNPTIASPYLREKLNLERNYINELKNVKFISTESLNWSRTIKGDIAEDDYPAEQFYNDLPNILRKVGFLKDLTIAECPISDILPEVTKTFHKQLVDFYIPLTKTVIEVDGSGHQAQKKLDEKRDAALNRFGISVVRIKTQDIRNRNYEGFKKQFRKIYVENKKRIDDYYKYLVMDRSEMRIQILLTSISRIQILLLELLNRDVLSLEDPEWCINIAGDNIEQPFQLAVEDLKLMLENFSSLFNKRVTFPEIKLEVFEDATDLVLEKNSVNIDFSLFKRWDDTLVNSNIYYVRTDFSDDENYFSVKVSEPVTYDVNEKSHSGNLEYILEILFGFEKFRSGQIEIIMNCLNGEDTVGLLPTGGGKSLVYQYCLLLQPAINFVVVPIKSLMMDQIENIRTKHFISHASFINSDLTPEESSRVLDNFRRGKYFFIIISPERFQIQTFRDDLTLINHQKAIAHAVIDEVHCLSEWGHDFRTSYLALANAIRRFAPSSRYIALTATASSKVLKDIVTELEIESHNVLTVSDFTRAELSFEIIQISKKEKTNQLLKLISTNSELTEQGPTLVFTTTVNGREGCFNLSHLIQKETTLNVGYYSGSAPKKEYIVDFSGYKERIQQSFMEDKLDVLVATKAFGMGIDKGNIRRTIHYGIPSSLESFYQEAGRAGRDRENSTCTVLYTPDTLEENQLNSIFGIKTDIDVLRKEQKKLSGDLNNLLFFLVSNLMNIEHEVNELYTFYQSKVHQKGMQVKIRFANDRDRSQKERFIYRLALIGIIGDWTMNWKLKCIEIELLEWTEESLTEKLESHIKKYDYNFSLDINLQTSEQFSEILADFHNSKQPFLKRIIHVLLKWYNDNVIYSRKRSLLMMKQYADEFTDSDNLQQKLETYFKRNDDVYFLEKLIGEEDKVYEWSRIFYIEEEGKELLPRAIGTFRGLDITISRFLESYNNDIALNLIAGFVKLTQNQFESVDGRERMSIAIRELLKRDSKNREKLLRGLLVSARNFLSSEQKLQLSDVMISSGFNQMPELKEIHSFCQDDRSLGEIIKNLQEMLKRNRGGGYPWET